MNERTKAMKKFIISLVVIAFTAVLPASAQGLQFGFKAGMNNTSMKFDTSVFDASNRFGWFIGPTVKFGLPVTGLGIDIAGLYDQKTTKVNGESIQQKYLLVPVNARLTLGIGDAAGLYVTAGPQFSFNIGDDVDFEWTHNDIRNTFQLKKSAFSVNLGAGFFLSRHLEFGFVYNVGVSSTAEASFDEGVKAISDDTKPKSWQISATYFF